MKYVDKVKTAFVGMRHKVQIANKIQKIILRKYIKKPEFTVEDMIALGKTKLATELIPELLPFHQFTVEMLEYELMHDVVYKTLNMKKYAQIYIEDLDLLKTIESIRAIQCLITQLAVRADKNTIDFFYYQTGLRYVSMCFVQTKGGLVRYV